MGSEDFPRASRSRHGNAVHEAGRVLQDPRRTIRRRRRSHKLDQVHPLPSHQRRELGRLVPRQIGHDQTREARLARLLHKRIRLRSEDDRIRNHRHERTANLTAHSGDAFKNVFELQMLVERPRVRTLDDRPVGDRIAVREADLDEIGSGRSQFANHAACCGDVGITCRQKRHERQLTLLFPPEKGGGDARCLSQRSGFLNAGGQAGGPMDRADEWLRFRDQSTCPVRRATSFTSLSPRPDKQTTMTSVGFRRFACSIA